MAGNPTFHVSIVSPQRVLFDGEAESLVLPGENGVFEVQPYHKRLLSRLLQGYIVLGKGDAFPIRRGVAKVGLNHVMVIVEE